MADLVGIAAVLGALVVVAIRVRRILGKRAAAVEQLASVAAGGDAKAQCDLADRYRLGLGVAADASAAASWYRRAADRDYAPALVSLGLLYAKGAGVAPDAAAAAELFRRAAELGDARGQYQFAAACRDGAGVAQDNLAALQWFALAAVQGHRDAVRGRDALAGVMSPHDREAALERARKWQPQPAPALQ